ncbi:hypothetical protein [Campylobacter helveticus]|uniref:hypothetical protein n=1 Tax=Campylobacter helveticus TaxID=28898 RepID=UPI00111695B0|nr:hypothetical protein [Campylobacter helveticus]TNH32521.1 hypothetical protein FDW46_09185 [Campylobacter helveticus]TNH34331.1 hypothetical protein FDW45_09015 [Campylobacter helveticus]
MEKPLAAPPSSPYDNTLKNVAVLQLQINKEYIIGDGSDDDFRNLTEFLKFFSRKVGAYNSNEVRVRIKKDLTFEGGFFNFPFLCVFTGDGAEDTYRHKITFSKGCVVNQVIFKNLALEITGENLMISYKMLSVDSCKIINNKNADYQYTFYSNIGYISFYNCVFEGSNNKLMNIASSGYGNMLNNKSGNVEISINQGGTMLLQERANTALNISVNIAKNTLTNQGICYEITN